jgi:phosphate transport system substrate-binding protein
MKVLVLAVALTLAIATSAQAREQIRIVGSSTVYPFSTTVAENFGKQSTYKTPVVESTGSGGGFKLFCSGVGIQHPDITNASRAIKKSEIKLCAKNGVNDISEVKIGFDGIVIANDKSGVRYNLNKKDIFLALAKTVPVDGKLVDNPHTTWKQVRSDLPDVKIEVLGPPPTSGTRDAFVELAMEGGAKEIPFLAEMKKTDKKKFEAIAHSIREDGYYVEAGENDNLIVQKLLKNSNALGIFGYSFLDNNSDKVQGSLINGVEPTFEAIASGEYKVSRSLFFYVKNQHLSKIPGITEFVEEFISDRATGKFGYLSDRGLIPLPEGMVKITLVR